MHDSTTQRRLCDILAGRTDEIREQWETTEAAAEFAPLPAGTYECHVQSVELFNARTGTGGAKLTFRVAEGEFAGRCIFHDCWLTAAALPATKRDLGKLGITRLGQLENGALPSGRIRCRVRVVLRRDDDGEQYNRVRRFDVLGIDEPEADPFAPADDADREYDPDETGGDADFDPARLGSTDEAEGGAA